MRDLGNKRIVTIGLLETTAANAIVYFSLNPLWAALMGLAFLGDRVQRHTVIAMAIAFTAVGVAFIPSMLAGPEADEPSGKHGVPSEGASSPTLHGDLIAFATGMTLAGFITSSRASSLGDNEAPMSVAPALGSLGASLLATPFAIHACLQRGGSSSGGGSGGGGAVSLSPSFLLFLLADATLEACYDVWMGEAAEFITRGGRGGAGLGLQPIHLRVPDGHRLGARSRHRGSGGTRAAT